MSLLFVTSAKTGYILEKPIQLKKKKNAIKERPTVKTTVKYCARQGPKRFVNSRNFHPLVAFEKKVWVAKLMHSSWSICPFMGCFKPDEEHLQSSGKSGRRKKKKRKKTQSGISVPVHLRDGQ